MEKNSGERPNLNLRQDTETGDYSSIVMPGLPHTWEDPFGDEDPAEQAPLSPEASIEDEAVDDKEM